MKPVINMILSCRTVQLAVVPLLGICLTSCATTSSRSQTATKRPPASTPKSGIDANWVKVRSNPPTWYPRGTRSDCPTDFRSGEWVETGDQQGTRYFIPLRVTGPTPRQTLVNEALAARSTCKKLRNSTDNVAICLKEAGNIVVGVPLTFLAWCGAAEASPDQSVTGSDLEFIRPLDF
jgi:hypothetical protein